MNSELRHHYFLLATASQNIIFSGVSNMRSAPELTLAPKVYHRFFADDFMHSYFFLKAQNHFPACGEKCLKQATESM